MSDDEVVSVALTAAEVHYILSSARSIRAQWESIAADGAAHKDDRDRSARFAEAFRLLVVKIERAETEFPSSAPTSQQERLRTENRRLEVDVATQVAKRNANAEVAERYQADLSTLRAENERLRNGLCWNCKVRLLEISVSAREYASTIAALTPTPTKQATEPHSEHADASLSGDGNGGWICDVCGIEQATGDSDG